MANQSSPSSIYFASFNQDNSGFARSLKDSFKIFDSTIGRLCYEEEEKGKELTLEEIHRLRAYGSRPAAPLKSSFSQVKKNTGRAAADKNIKFSETKKPARANKNIPIELSSRRPVNRYREVIQAPKKELLLC
ncbi:hypothetical protein Bca4012_023726 [Brassica carinata]